MLVQGIISLWCWGNPINSNQPYDWNTKYLPIVFNVVWLGDIFEGLTGLKYIWQLSLLVKKGTWNATSTEWIIDKSHFSYHNITTRTLFKATILSKSLSFHVNCPSCGQVEGPWQRACCPGLLWISHLSRLVASFRAIQASLGWLQILQLSTIVVRFAVVKACWAFHNSPGLLQIS